ncbi:uncharacterized protein [Dermacentor albipictus]|uniref:uncharacterized protein isoform X3 n=1 Tax=Dermacentor albipictus TaxID=60249 RepID=UPI0038FC87C0
MELRSQSDAPALHKDATTTGRVLRHAAQQHDRCGLAQRSATASAQGYARSQPPCGRTIHGRHRGIFRIGGCHVSAFLWSGESCPRAFVDGTADSGMDHRADGPCHNGRGPAGAPTASLFVPALVTKTIAHLRRNEIAAGTTPHPRRSLHQPRVVEASAHRLTIARRVRSPGQCSNGGAWRKDDVSGLKCTHSLRLAASARGVEGPAVLAIDALPRPTASTTGASTHVRGVPVPPRRALRHYTDWGGVIFAKILAFFQAVQGRPGCCCGGYIGFHKIVSAIADLEAWLHRRNLVDGVPLENSADDAALR